MDTIKRMVIFARVVELGAFTRAAQELGLTTSAISQHVRALEEELGITLLHRSTRRLSLTDAGRVFFEECVNVAHAAMRARQKVAELRDELAGELRISAPPEFTHRHLVSALKDFIATNPRLSIRFDLADERIDLIERRIDLAIRIGELHDSRLVARKIGWFEELICAAPSFLQRAGQPTTPQELAAHEWVLFSPLGEPAFITLHHHSEETARFRVSGRLITNQSESLHSLVLAGHGIARLLQAYVQDDLDEGRLVHLVPDWRLTGFGAYAITPRRDAQPVKVTRCIEHLVAYFSRAGLQEPPQRPNDRKAPHAG